MTTLNNEQADEQEPADDPDDAPETDDEPRGPNTDELPEWYVVYLASPQYLEDWPQHDDDARHAHELDSATRAAQNAELPPPLAPLGSNGSTGPHITAAMYDAALEHDPDDPLHRIFWPDFWARDRREPEWLAEPILARGRGHVIYAAHKVGKSLVMLWVATQLATNPSPTIVLYLDYEMGEDDLFERLLDMGYGPDSNLSRLHYALLPSIPPLDTKDGAAELFAAVDDIQERHPDYHLAVILDTTARALAGPENDSDTIRGFAHHTGIGLRQRRCTWARLDHSGKDGAKGQRGSSAKGDDVDVIWRLTASETGYLLKRDAARMSWIPEKVALHRRDYPLAFNVGEDAYAPGTKEAADLLDRLGVPVDASRRTARAAVRDAGETASNEALGDALRYRRSSDRP